MVWGAFIGSTKSPLVFLDGTQTAMTFIQQVYEPHLRPFYNFMFNAPYIRTRDCITMMEDGSPIHTAQILNEWRATNQINKFPWPAHSPDLNPIENVWKVMKTHVTKHHQPHTMDELCAATKSSWDDLSPAFLRNCSLVCTTEWRQLLNAMVDRRDVSKDMFRGTVRPISTEDDFGILGQSLCLVVGNR
ncbi:hypothetical protein O181_031447 [Austropuccinia psidii MF-1]|uniref:Tc1-like transposase DDE domain-containing protein n=1 Tax=Austropuccinia psidii MF-1 TaxID=1389203 RepID=A0A9Q3D0P0_9BASI|nr:hypothetical protein [Austropuccinia psidii MF-1]